MPVEQRRAGSGTSSLTDLDRSTQVDAETDGPWCTVVWNDPVNLMSYVVFVLRRHFGYSRLVAEQLMMQVHEEGRAIGLARLARADGDRRAGDAFVRPAGDLGESGGGLMAHAFRRRADGSLACRLDSEEKAIISQVAQETADLIRADLGIDAGPGVCCAAAASEIRCAAWRPSSPGRMLANPPTPPSSACSPPPPRTRPWPASSVASASRISPTGSSPTSPP